MGADKKFFGKNSAYDPKSNPRILHTNSSNHQDHVVTTNLPILRMILERWEEVVESKTKTRDEERKQNGQLRVQLGHPDIGGGSPASQQTQTGSPGHRGWVTRHPIEPKRVTLTKEGGSPCAPRKVTRGTNSNFRSMDLPNRPTD